MVKRCCKIIIYNSVSINGLFQRVIGENMSLEEMKSIIIKKFGVNSIGSLLGSCTENFLNSKILEEESV